MYSIMYDITMLCTHVRMHEHTNTYTNTHLQHARHNLHRELRPQPLDLGLVALLALLHGLHPHRLCTHNDHNMRSKQQRTHVQFCFAVRHSRWLHDEMSIMNGVHGQKPHLEQCAGLFLQIIRDLHAFMNRIRKDTPTQPRTVFDESDE